MNEKTLQGTIESKVREVLFPLFERYDMDAGNLDAILKWKPPGTSIGDLHNAGCRDADDGRRGVLHNRCERAGRGQRRA